jgi:hypothetical protein
MTNVISRVSVPYLYNGLVTYEVTLEGRKKFGFSPVPSFFWRVITFWDFAPRFLRKAGFSQAFFFLRY